MNTAKTLQLLDANNNNISPATCVDSLYFEKINGDVTYRMSLKNRILVASDSIVNTLTVPSNPTSLSDIKIPYFKATAASGTGGIYELKSETLNLGTAISNAIDNISKFAERTYVDSSFLKVDGTNYMTGALRVGTPSTSTGVLISNDSLIYNNKFAINNTTSLNPNNLNIRPLTYNSSYGICIDAASVYIGCGINGSTGLTNNVSIGSNYVKNITMTSNERLDVNSSIITIASRKDLSIGSYDDVNIFSQLGNMTIMCHTADKTINIDASTIKLYGKVLTNPSTGTSLQPKVLTYTRPDASMIWTDLPKLTLTAPNASDNVYMDTLSHDATIKFRDITFTGTLSGSATRSVLMNSSTGTDEYIYIRSFKDRRNGVTNLCGTNANDMICVATINNESIFSTTLKNLSLMTPADASVYNKTNIRQITNSSTYYVYGGDSTNATTKPTTGTVEATTVDIFYTPTIYYKNDGTVYANAFYATSDERLKTDIQDVVIDEMPQIKKFAWKDTSTYTYGFIAQDLEKQGYDELVATDEQGFKKVNYEAALSMTIGALQNENKELKYRLNKLETLVESLINK